MILETKNRTENWKTARCLQPFFGDRAIRMAQVLGESEDTKPEDISLEPFWKGVRDWCAKEEDKSCCKKRLVKSCRKLFPDLRQRVKRYGKFRTLRDGNYEISSDAHCKQLFNNLFNTEIDIVLEPPGRLYIGEAKSESSFDANASPVLVHQLVRQYVMARVLVDVLECDREVVPFVIVDRTPRKWPRQVQFMVKQGWMCEEHRFTWDALEAMACG